MKTEIKKAYEKRHNIWRCNVPKKISKFHRVPDWFKDMTSIKVKTNISKLLKKMSRPKEVKPSLFSRLVAYIKRIFKIC